MPNEYKWSRLEPLVKTVDGLENAVVSLVAGMTCSNGTHSAYMDTMITLTVDPDKFVAFADLSLEWAIGHAEKWAEENDVRASLDKQLEAAAARPTSKPFSWQEKVEPAPSE
jgi:hypothetical protein